MGVSFILILLIVSVRSLYLPDVKPPKTNVTAMGEEIQHAICKITSKDLEATANATIFRELKGVCTSVELQAKLNQMQLKILKELEDIKNVLRENGFNIPKNNQQSLPLPTTLQQEPVVTGYKDFFALHGNFITEQSTTNRLQEINTYNDSVVDSNKGSIYFYYWAIKNVDTILSKKQMYLSSPDVYILGHSLHLQLYPNYLDDDSFAIQLRPSSRGFVKKHKIYIVNQVDKNRDIDSGLMFGFKEESLFRVSEDIINESGYVQNRILIVKLEIYLNS